MYSSDYETICLSNWPAFLLISEIELFSTREIGSFVKHKLFDLLISNI